MNEDSNKIETWLLCTCILYKHIGTTVYNGIYSNKKETKKTSEKQISEKDPVNKEIGIFYNFIELQVRQIMAILDKQLAILILSIRRELFV